jgi:GNAT superfamily N-acetyltransferase
MTTRLATADDAAAIAALVNRAYEVERFFVEGDRVTPAAIREDLAVGNILLVVRPDGGLRACVYVHVSAGRGYFGMLAVDPDEQGSGLGRGLIQAAEDYARMRGARVMGISVVHLRTELLEFYQRLGYVRTGTEPYVHRPVIQPVHFITMEKALAPG